MTAKDLTEANRVYRVHHCTTDHWFYAANRDNRDGNRNLRFLRLLATCRSCLPWPAEAERAKAAVRNLKTKSMKITTMEMKTEMVIAAFSFALGAVCALPAWAQNAEPSKDDSFTKYGQEFKGKIGRTYAESQEWYPEGVKP